MRSHPKKLHLLMPDAAPGGDSLYTTNFEVDTFTYFAFAMLTVEHELMMYNDI